jgi:hypothetical protein
MITVTGRRYNIDSTVVNHFDTIHPGSLKKEVRQFPMNEVAEK